MLVKSCLKSGQSSNLSFSRKQRMVPPHSTLFVNKYDCHNIFLARIHHYWCDKRKFNLNTTAIMIYIFILSIHWFFGHIDGNYGNYIFIYFLSQSTADLQSHNGSTSLKKLALCEKMRHVNNIITYLYFVRRVLIIFRQTYPGLC